MMTPATEWYMEQSKYNRRFYEWLQEVRPNDAHDWKIVALFYSELHRVNYRFARETGRAPENHFKRNRRVRHELPRARRDYGDLCDKHAGGVPRGAQAHTRYKPTVEAADRITDALPL